MEVDREANQSESGTGTGTCRRDKKTETKFEK